MEVLEYSSSMTEELASIYNEAVRDVPHCWPVSAERYARAMPAATDEDDGVHSMRDNAVFVAAEGGSVLGYVHAAIAAPKEQEPAETGVMRFLWYRPGHRSAGQKLLETGEDYLRGRALVEMKKAGYRHAAISAGWDNYRAISFYSNYGYRVVDWAYGLQRGLRAASARETSIRPMAPPRNSSSPPMQVFAGLDSDARNGYADGGAWRVGSGARTCDHPT